VLNAKTELLPPKPVWPTRGHATRCRAPGFGGENALRGQSQFEMANPDPGPQGLRLARVESGTPGVSLSTPKLVALQPGVAPRGSPDRFEHRNVDPGSNLGKTLVVFGRLKRRAVVFKLTPDAT